MDGVMHRRVTAEIEGEFVLFLVGIRINKPWKIHKWLSTLLAMRDMLNELDAHPEAGCLGYTRLGGLTFAQYWRSFGHLEAYARSNDRMHWPAWIAFNRRMRACRSDVGIWHETYCVKPGQYETLYSGMPAFGIGAAGQVMSATRSRENARGRMRASARMGPSLFD